MTLHNGIENDYSDRRINVFENFLKFSRIFPSEITIIFNSLLC